MSTRLTCFLGAILILGVIGLHDFWKSAHPSPTPVPSARQIEDDNYAGAVYLCEQWTEKNSRVAVDEFIGEHRTKRAKGSKYYSVQVDYRTKGAGWPMRTRCQVAHDTPQSDYVLLSARSELNTEP